MRILLRRSRRVAVAGVAAAGLTVGMLAAGSGSAWADAYGCTHYGYVSGYSCIHVFGSGLKVNRAISEFKEVYYAGTVCDPAHTITYWVVRAPSRGGDYQTSWLAYGDDVYGDGCFSNHQNEELSWYPERDFPDGKQLCSSTKSAATGGRWTNYKCETIHS